LRKPGSIVGCHDEDVRPAAGLSDRQARVCSEHTDTVSNDLCRLGSQIDHANTNPAGPAGRSSIEWRSDDVIDELPNRVRQGAPLDDDVIELGRVVLSLGRGRVQGWPQQSCQYQPQKSE
jgi:hypothetical protein